jgi:HEPN domain-containing protein
MYTTTATPMGYGWTYDRFEVMDKDNVWIGYATEWLDQAYDNLSDAYAALDGAGRTTVPSSVASAETKAEAVIADAVAKLTGGRYLEAARASRQAVDATGRVLRVAVKQTRK